MLPDNRIVFTPTRLDFATDVGLTGQEHDSYPAPGSQARYDWFRSVMIGLLAQQSSYEAPTQYRDGTPWFDLNTLTLKIRKDGAWVSYAEVIGLTEPDTDGNFTTLADWFTSANETLTNLAPEVFSGQCTTDDVSDIPIPTALQSYLASDSRVFLHINGLFVDPRNCSLLGSPPTTIRISGATLGAGDSFSVSVRRISTSTFMSTAVVIP